MTTIYVRHDVTTVAEVNALALDEDQRENAAIVLYEGNTCYWSINWATRNEIPGRWYDNSGDGLQLVDGDEVAVLVPIVESEVRKAKAEAWDEGCMEATNGDDDPLANPYRYETGDQ